MTLDRGKIAVLSMLALAVAAAAFAWAWNARRGARCLAFYGSEAAALIRTAPLVEILEIDPAASGVAVTRRIDISRAPGLLNARAALLDDASFDWNSPPAATAAGSTRLVRFAAGQREVLLALHPDKRALEVVPDGKLATLDPKTSAGWKQFLERYP
jgi:hypothetical protein